MFTGIIESLARVTATSREGSNLTITLQSSITHELKIDQSVAHNGVCLTVTGIKNDEYTVVAVDETLQKTNLAQLATGAIVNLERAMLPTQRLDGHMVQGHVDGVGKCISVTPQDGSWVFRIQYPRQFAALIVEKGSICLNGISLTVFDITDNAFSVAIIPYTFEHTTMQSLKAGDAVNLEFDILGKYVARQIAANLVNLVPASVEP
ncbi:riboflavin synthase alpha chain [Chitinophaga skermanii]|uniref:Riboflavin synthase n=1 Tax=Chitinophaga skermanii TaxID=331697 RepID=A0A327Q7L7_9BACT|nr:riboflavin synthase [Chitinophaga skermanii]RAI99721.1 riboflavin synthase alpha chain [Chitinophaga skermanii]